MDNISAFISTNIGQVDNGVDVEVRRNTDGSSYYRASTKITHIFGSEINNGEGYLIEAFGTTKEQACQRLDKELRDFNDSLWF